MLDAAILKNKELEAIAAYLNGITIFEHYNRNERVVKKEFYFGIEGAASAQRRIGVETFQLVFPKKITASKTRTYRFFR